MATGDDWPEMAAELCRVLTDGLDVGGTIDETELIIHVGSASLEIVIEASDIEGFFSAFIDDDIAGRLAA